MHAAWFAALALMLTAYAVLDGFDFGAGIVHLFVARTDAERRTVLGAIGPLWDGNEVWLIASGGVLFFAFPRAYAAAFSGLYLALMLVLWLLILRGISIEFRSQVAHPLWHAAWDATFAGSSAAMAIVLGVAIGNVVRGVPIDKAGYFEQDLFAAMDAVHPGAIDPFTAVFGLLGLATFGAHGATFLDVEDHGRPRGAVHAGGALAVARRGRPACRGDRAHSPHGARILRALAGATVALAAALRGRRLRRRRVARALRGPRAPRVPGVIGVRRGDARRHRGHALPDDPPVDRGRRLHARRRQRGVREHGPRERDRDLGRRDDPHRRVLRVSLPLVSRQGRRRRPLIAPHAAGLDFTRAGDDEAARAV